METHTDRLSWKTAQRASRSQAIIFKQTHQLASVVQMTSLALTPNRLDHSRQAREESRHVAAELLFEITPRALAWTTHQHAQATVDHEYRPPLMPGQLQDEHQRDHDNGCR